MIWKQWHGQTISNGASIIERIQVVIVCNILLRRSYARRLGKKKLIRCFASFDKLENRRLTFDINMEMIRSVQNYVVIAHFLLRWRVTNFVRKTKFNLTSFVRMFSIFAALDISSWAVALSAFLTMSDGASRIAITDCFRVNSDRYIHGRKTQNL